MQIEEITYYVKPSVNWASSVRVGFNMFGRGGDFSPSTLLLFSPQGLKVKKQSNSQLKNLQDNNQQQVNNSAQKENCDSKKKLNTAKH